jgi:hypothetical protein
MGAAVIIVLLAGLALPITLILAAVVVDMAGLLWYAYRLWHDDWSPRAWEFVTVHMFQPAARLAHGSGLGSRVP